MSIRRVLWFFFVFLVSLIDIIPILVIDSFGFFLRGFQSLSSLDVVAADFGVVMSMMVSDSWIALVDFKAQMMAEPVCVFYASDHSKCLTARCRLCFLL